jgi:FAD/FMN-containing dehydrogenase
VLANGETIAASPQNNGDLFHGTTGSYGTLGIITATEIKLVPAHKYVQLTYIPVDSFESAIAKTEKCVSQKYDYIDGIMFSDENGVVIVGNMVDEIIGHKQRFSRAHDPWFYLHAEKISQQKEQITETVPLVDYLFRYDRGAFWVGKYAFDIFNQPFTPFMRWLLNPILHTRKLYQALQESGVSQKYLVQDMTVPLSKAVEFMKFIDKTLKIYPLWILPMKPDSLSSLEPNNIETPLAINIGIWGNKIESYEKFVSLNKLLENELKLLRGRKVLYAQSFYTEKEFWDIYDKDDYQKLRQKYHAENLQDVFKKTRVNTEYDVNLKRGLYRALFRRAKLRIDNE